MICLGEKILEERLVRKVLRSLIKRFNVRVIAIEEAHDIASMKVDELFGSLLTSEMSLNGKLEKKTRKLPYNPQLKKNMT